MGIIARDNLELHTQARKRGDRFFGLWAQLVGQRQRSQSWELGLAGHIVQGCHIRVMGEQKHAQARVGRGRHLPQQGALRRGGIRWEKGRQHLDRSKHRDPALGAGVERQRIPLERRRKWDLVRGRLRFPWQRFRQRGAGSVGHGRAAGERSEALSHNLEQLSVVSSAEASESHWALDCSLIHCDE
jgi:hypothetical protein